MNVTDDLQFLLQGSDQKAVSPRFVTNSIHKEATKEKLIVTDQPQVHGHLITVRGKLAG